MAEIPAELVGTILEISVHRGDTVAVGDELLVVESMKMEIPVLAEDPGVVEEVRVAVGDVVRAGEILLTLADAP